MPRQKPPELPHPLLNTDDPDHPLELIKAVIREIGDDPDREGLKETPERVSRAWQGLFCGYGMKPEEVFKVFEDGACDEMVLLKNCPFTSFCEHHLLPFSGTAHVAYLPDKKIIGLSKLARLLDLFAARLQVQERLTVQVTTALMEHLKPQGAACVIEAQHLCLSCRGAKKPGATMVTSSMLGAFREKPEARAEFFSLIRS